MGEIHKIRVAMRDQLEANWDGLSGRHEPPPGWLESLAVQLQLWVGDELDDPLHLEISFDPPPADLPLPPGELTEANALNSELLYLRALTKSYFVDVEVKKVAGERGQVATTVLLVPRDRLQKLAAKEIVMRGPNEPDALQLRVSYAGAGEYLIPRNVENDDEAWRTERGVKLFGELRGDLWMPVVTDSVAEIRI